MSVDLDRLREAVWDHRQDDDDTILEELVRAVLDAPIVWWCEMLEEGAEPDQCPTILALLAMYGTRRRGIAVGWL